MFPYFAAITLILCWLLALTLARTFNGWIHLLLILAILLLVFRTVSHKEKH